MHWMIADASEVDTFETTYRVKSFIQVQIIFKIFIQTEYYKQVLSSDT